MVEEVRQRESEREGGRWKKLLIWGVSVVMGLSIVVWLRARLHERKQTTHDYAANGCPWLGGAL
jgi:hypothetical protein